MSRGLYLPLPLLRLHHAVTEAAGIPFSATELNGHAHSNAYTHQAFCPTVKFLTSYLGPYTGTCVAPPNPGGSSTG